MEPGETRVDPSALQTRADMARELTALRVGAGLSIRTLSRRLDLPPATVGDYFSGRHLPGPSQLDPFRALLRECGVPDKELGGWIDALNRVRHASDRRVGRTEVPYRGLEPFDALDAELFFGREAVTAQALTHLQELHGNRQQRPKGAVDLIVLGASGAGKSSLLRAGIEASVRMGALDDNGGTWAATTILPGASPVAALERAATELGHEPHVLIVDQLEEIFGAAPAERAQLLDELARLRSDGTLVVVALRADFFASALSEPLLVGALASHPVLLGPMNEAEIRRAIHEPAHQVGARVEPGLADLLLAELSPAGPLEIARATGALPLLSHALLATWNHAQGNELTIEDYQAIGGLRGAVSQTAEQLYGQLDHEQQGRARRIFCSLVRVSDDAPLTRRRAPRNEIDELDSGAEPRTGAHDGTAEAAAHATSVLERFVAARLLTVTTDTVELSHEVLMTAWPRLAEWIEQDRDGLRLHHQIADASRTWTESDHDPSLLLRGPRLQTASEWAREPEHQAVLTQTERRFLEQSLAQYEAERRAERARTRRMRQLAAGLAVLAIAAGVLAVLAVRSQHLAVTARNEARSRLVAIEANTLEASDPALAMQLALTAYRISPTLQATSALIDSSAYEMPTRILGVDGPTTLALSGNGRGLAVAASAVDRVTLYRMSAAGIPARIARVSPGIAGQQLYALAISPNGRLMAAGGSSGKVTLWSLANPARPSKIATLSGFKSTVYSVAFRPDGGALAAADADGTLRQWSLGDPTRPASLAVLEAPGHESLQAVTYSPDGRALAAAGAGGVLTVWPAGAGGVQPLATRTLAGVPLTSVAYSPNGRTLAVGSEDDLVYILKFGANDHPQGEHSPLHGFTSWVDSLAFSHDGRYLAGGSSDSTLQIFSTATWGHVATLVHPAPVTGVAFSPGDGHLISADEDGTARVWSFPPPAAITQPGGVFTIDYTADGAMAASVSGGPRGDVELWNTSDPWKPARRATITLGPSFGPAAGVMTLSPSGKLVAVGDAQAKAQLVDLANPRRPKPIGPELLGAKDLIELLDFSPKVRELSVADETGRIDLWGIADPTHPMRLGTIDPTGLTGAVLGDAYSPDGKLLAAGSNDDKVRLWNVTDPYHPRLVSVLGGFKSYAYTVAFTPDGKTLIAGSADDSIRLWDIRDPAHPRLLGHPLTASTSTIYDVAVNPSGKILAAATTGHDVLVWNIENPAHPIEVADLTAASGTMYDVTFSPDGRTLAAGGAAPTIRFWDYRPAILARRICELAGAPITRSEWSQYVQGAPYAPPCTKG